MAKKIAKKKPKKKASAAEPAVAAKRSITIKGNFTGEVNNHTTLNVFRPNSVPHPYDFRREYITDFTEVLDDLLPGLVYSIDLNGHTTTTFELEITGEFKVPNPIKDSFSNTSFSPWYFIETT